METRNCFTCRHELDRPNREIVRDCPAWAAKDHPPSKNEGVENIVEQLRDMAEIAQARERLYNEIATEILCRFAELTIKCGFADKQRREAFHVVLGLVKNMGDTWLYPTQ